LEFLWRDAVAIRKNRHSFDGRQRFHQDFLPFAIKLGAQQADTRRVALGFRERSDKARSDHIFRDAKDWNRFCRLLRGTDGRIAGSGDNVHLGHDNGRGMFSELIHVQPKASVVDNEISSVDETTGFHCVE
jgi:hypothetical protein